MAGTDGGEQLDQRLVGCTGLRGEPRDAVADVGGFEGGLLVDRAGEVAPAERAERDEADPELLEGGEDLLLGFAPPQGVLALQSRDGLHGVGPADGGDAGLGQAEVADFAFLDEPGDRTGDLLDWDVGVDAVLVEQVDSVDAEAAQGPVDGVADVLRAARQAGLAAVSVEGEPELGRDIDLLSIEGERFTDEFLVEGGAVDLGGVEEGDTSLDRCPDHGDAVGVVSGGSEAVADAHAAKPEIGDLQAVSTKGARVHVVRSFLSSDVGGHACGASSLKK